MNSLSKYRYLITRRAVQIGILFLFFASNKWGFDILQGNLSFSKVLGIVPLSDPFALLQMLFAGAVVGMDVFVGAVIVIVFYSVVGGRVFCSYVCPMNMVTDAAHYLREKTSLSKVQKKQFVSNKIRYWVLALSLLLSAIFGVAAFEFVSPISMLHRNVIFGFGFGGFAVLVVFLFDLLVLKNGWCGHICPLGAFYSLLGKASLVRVRYDNQKCTVCMECKKVCPEPDVLHTIGRESSQILSGACLNCARCIEVCEDEALDFSIRDFIKKDKI